MINVRPAMALDTASMSDLLNAIIKKGGTTALVRPVTAQDLAQWMASDPNRSAWHVAVNENEQVIGFQWISPHTDLPPEAADIATFVELGRSGLGIGSALFAATSKAAKALGYRWVNATIRADNAGGLIYYQSRGFRDWAFDEGIELQSGEIVDKISKRYDL